MYEENSLSIKQCLVYTYMKKYSHMLKTKKQHLGISHKAILPHVSTRVPVVLESVTIGHVEQLLLSHIHSFESIHYIYVVDEVKVLKGVLSIKELFRLPKKKLVREAMKKHIISAHEHTHQERVAYLALHHKLKAIPIVSSHGHFIGVVTGDSILSILQSEASENLFRMGGMTNNFGPVDDVYHIPLWKSLRHRLPWLFIGLMGGVMASGIVDGFEAVLSKHFILATFIPLIVYMGDAVGTQMEAYIIRDFAMSEKLQFMSYFYRHLRVVVCMSIISSLVLWGALILFSFQTNIAFVVSLSLFLAMMSSLATGLVVPYVFHKFKADPANASGPIATIIQDMMSIIVYFSVATWLL